MTDAAARRARSRRSARSTPHRSPRGSTPAASPRIGPTRSWPARIGRTRRSFDDLTDLPRPLRAALARPSGSASIADSHVIGADGGMTAKAVHELRRRAAHRVGPHALPGARRVSASGPRSASARRRGARWPARSAPPARPGSAGSSRRARSSTRCCTGTGRRGTRSATAPAGHYNIVFMGMGEPLNNADRVFEAVRLLNDPARLGIGARHITVSTSGVVPGMDRMVDELPQVNLAISLHAATDDLRDELVPINRKWPIAEVDRRRPPLRGPHRPAGEPRVRDDRRPQRHRRAGRRPGGAGRAAGARTSTSSRSIRRPARAGAARRRPASSASSGSCATAASRSPCATPAAARSRRPAASSTPSSPGRSLREAREALATAAATA